MQNGVRTTAALIAIGLFYWLGVTLFVGESPSAHLRALWLAAGERRATLSFAATGAALGLASLWVATIVLPESNMLKIGTGVTGGTSMWLVAAKSDFWRSGESFSRSRSVRVLS